MSYNIHIFNQPDGDGWRLVVSTEYIEIIFTGRSYEMFNDLFFNNTIADEFFDPILEARTEDAVHTWLRTIVENHASISNGYLDITGDIDIIVICEISSNGTNIQSINSWSAVIWGMSMLYFLFTILSTYPIINWVSVFCVIALIALKPYLLVNKYIQ